MICDSNSLLKSTGTENRVKEIRIVGLGGTLRPGSSTERVIFHVLRYAEALGAETSLFSGEMISLPIYVPGEGARCARATALLTALRGAHAIVVGSPGYHGGISGLVKNALDYTEDMARDPAPYFAGRAVGCVATGSGWQGANSTLNALRNVIHALRGWPSPLGIAINTQPVLFDSEGECTIGSVSDAMRIMAAQLVDFASR
jgi:FMN reductase